MKKILIILWIIIIAGATFIFFHFYKPTPVTNDKVITKEQEITLSDKAPKTYNEYIASGDSSLANSQFDQAISYYKTAVKINPTSTAPLLKLGDAYLANNNSADALTTFQEAQKINPNEVDPQIGITRTYLANRDIQSAKNTAWALDQTNPATQYYKGIILILYKDFEGAKKTFEELVQKNPTGTDSENAKKFLASYKTFSYYEGGEQIYLETLLAKNLTEVDEYNSAIRLLYDVIDQKNNYRDAWIILGYAYLNTNKISDSIDAFKQAKTLNETKPETLFYLGLAYFANDEIEKAIYYLELSDKNGFEPKEELNLKLAQLYTIKEEYQKASSKYDEILSLNTKNLDVFELAVWLNIDKLNNGKKALQLSAQALKENPDSAMSYNLAGWALTSNGNYPEAKKYLAKALQINPKLDAAFLNLGWLYEKQGSDVVAKEYYKKAFVSGKGSQVSIRAAAKFNDLTKNELKSYYIKAGISAPNP